MEQTNTVVYKNKKSRNKNLNVFVIFLFIILLIYSLMFLFTLGWGFLTSIKSTSDFHDANNILGLPDLSLWEKEGHHIFYNYESVLTYFSDKKLVLSKFYKYGLNFQHQYNELVRPTFGDIMFNTICYAVGGSVVIAIVPCVMGYLCANYRYKFSSVVISITLFVMVLPIVGSMPARITLLRRLDLFDRIIGDMMVNFTFTNMYFLVFHGFFGGMGSTYAEAAEVDGASQFRTMFTICLPLAIKMVTTVILVFFISRWNDYNTPLMYLPSKATLSYVVYKMTSGSSAGVSPFVPTNIASCMFVALPMVLLFILLKNQLMGNISMGGIKE